MVAAGDELASRLPWRAWAGRRSESGTDQAGRSWLQGHRARVRTGQLLHRDTASRWPNITRSVPAGARLGDFGHGNAGRVALQGEAAALAMEGGRVSAAWQ